MIQRYNQCFVLGTDHTTYCFRVMKTGHLEHLYYGRKITLTCDEDADALIEKQEVDHLCVTLRDRQYSLVHKAIARFVKMDGEIENCCAYGDTLMYGGVRLKQAFGGTGYSGKVRHFPDFASRIYLMEAMEGS